MADAPKPTIIGYWVDPDYVPPPETVPPPLGPQVHAPEIWFDRFNEDVGIACTAKGCDWGDDKDPIGWADRTYTGSLTTSLTEMHAMFGRHLAERFHGR